MTFLLSPELAEFQKTLRKYFEKEFPSTAVRHSLSGEGPRKFTENLARQWNGLRELGVFLAGIPESFGGLGFGFESLAVVVEEAGRVLCPLPVFETLTFGLLPIVVCGTKGTPSAGFQGEIEQILSACPRISGAAFSEVPQSLAISAYDFAERIYLLNRVGKSKDLEMIVCETNLNECDSKEHSAFDLLHPVQNLSCSGKKEGKKELSLGTISNQLLAEIQLKQSTLAASELAALGSAIISLAVEHAKTRQQFGKPIGSFQAVQQKLADMHLLVEQARSLARHAAWSVENSPDQFFTSAHSAKGYASETIPQVIESALQVLGGIGFTFEHDLHLYLRRAQALALQFGTASDHYLALGDFKA